MAEPRILLEGQLVAPITSVLGLSLVSIEYAVVPGELPEAWATAPSLVVGFGPILHFSNGRSLTFFAVEGPTWPHRFTVRASLDPFSAGDCVVRVPASHALWGCNALDRALAAASVHGWAASPHLVRLSFGSSSLVVANGTPTDPGESDDILLATVPDAVFATPSELFWASHPGA